LLLSGRCWFWQRRASERAQAMSLSNPGAAATVQDSAKQATTEVRWHHRWHRRCWRCR